MFNKLQQLKQHFQTDTLFQNSVYLMMSSAMQAGLGFGFWILCAHLFTPEQIGQSSALLSAMTMISYCSLLGFNSTFIRYLPTSKQRSEKINTGLILVLGTGLVLALGYALLIPVVTPQLSFVHDSLPLTLGFIVMAGFAAINLLTDSIFVAYRAAKYNLYVYVVMSTIKLALPLAFLGLGGYGVFAAQGAAGILALVLSLYYLARHFSYRPMAKVDKAIVRLVFRFSSGNYVANLLNVLPAVLLPIIVLGKLGAAAAGYFYLAFMVANLLYTTAYAVSQSLFAEGSYDNAGLRQLVKRSVIILSALMIPGAILLAILGPFLLQIFGKSYSNEAGSLIVVLALAGPAVAFYITTTVLLRIKKLILPLNIVNAVYLVSIIGLALLWADQGLSAMAWAWLVGHAVSGMLALLYLRAAPAETQR